MFPNGILIKGKFDNALNLSIASKYAINKQFNLTAAFQLAFGAVSLVNLSKSPPFPLGFQFDVNV